MQVGVHADKLHNLLSEEKFESRPNAADVGNGIKRRPWDGTSQDELKDQDETGTNLMVD